MATQGGAESGALGAEKPLDDPRLVEVVNTWTGLPDAVKAGILAMIRVAGGAG